MPGKFSQDPTIYSRDIRTKFNLKSKNQKRNENINIKIPNLNKSIPKLIGLCVNDAQKMLVKFR